MASRLRLSPRYGLNPTVSVCFWCGKDKDEVALLGRLEGDVRAPARSVVNYEPCHACIEKMRLGFAVVEATATPNVVTRYPIQGGVYPTGRYAVIEPARAAGLFGYGPEVSKCFLISDEFREVFEGVTCQCAAPVIAGVFAPVYKCHAASAAI